MLNPKIFNETLKIQSIQPQIDCFATRINIQLPEYFSGRPDEEGKFTDAFKLIGLPLCAIFSLPLPCHHVYCKIFKWSK